MSANMYANEYIIASNNTINENKYNAQKMAKTRSHKLKRMLKPILRMLRQKTNNANTISAPHKQSDDDYSAEYDNKKNFSIESCQQNVSDCYDYDNYYNSSLEEGDDNSANEELESRIFREIDACPADAAMYVYNSNDEYELQSVERDQKFVPVHFARTEAGTFFWTTIQRPVDMDLVQPTYCTSAFQQPQLQYGDRWVQA